MDLGDLELHELLKLGASRKTRSAKTVETNACRRGKKDSKKIEEYRERCKKTDEIRNHAKRKERLEKIVAERPQGQGVSEQLICRIPLHLIRFRRPRHQIPRIEEPRITNPVIRKIVDKKQILGRVTEFHGKPDIATNILLLMQTPPQGMGRTKVKSKMDFEFFENQDNVMQKLYRNVLNTAEIRKLIFSAKLPFALLKPKMIIDPSQLSNAVKRAQYNKKAARTVRTDIVYPLRPSKNILESLKSFIAQDEDTDILVIGEKDLFQKLHEQICGEEIPLESIPTLTDISLIRSVYQIQDEELQNSNIVESVISSGKC